MISAGGAKTTGLKWVRPLAPLRQTTELNGNAAR